MNKDPTWKKTTSGKAARKSCIMLTLNLGVSPMTPLPFMLTVTRSISLRLLMAAASGALRGLEEESREELRGKGNYVILF